MEELAATFLGRPSDLLYERVVACFCETSLVPTALRHNDLRSVALELSPGCNGIFAVSARHEGFGPQFGRQTDRRAATEGASKLRMHGNSIAALHLTLLHCTIVNELLRLVLRWVVAGTMGALTRDEPTRARN